MDIFALAASNWSCFSEIPGKVCTAAKTATWMSFFLYKYYYNSESFFFRSGNNILVSVSRSCHDGAGFGPQAVYDMLECVHTSVYSNVWHLPCWNSSWHTCHLLAQYELLKSGEGDGDHMWIVSANDVSCFFVVFCLPCTDCFNSW